MRKFNFKEYNNQCTNVYKEVEECIIDYNLHLVKPEEYTGNIEEECLMCSMREYRTLVDFAVYRTKLKGNKETANIITNYPNEEICDY